MQSLKYSFYIYKFSRCFYPNSGYTLFSQYVCSLGIEPTTFCAANAVLYHWATGAIFIKIILRPFYIVEFLMNIAFDTHMA